MNEKEKYLAFLKQRVDSAVDSITAAAAQSIGISNKTDISEQESREILEALSGAAGNLANIYEYLKKQKKKKEYKEVTVHLKFRLNREDDYHKSDAFIEDDLIESIKNCAIQYEIGDIDIETKEVEA